MKVSPLADTAGTHTVRVDRTKLVEAVNATARLLQQLHTMLVSDDENDVGPQHQPQHQPKRQTRRGRR